jgi:hypothetical protein
LAVRCLHHVPGLLAPIKPVLEQAYYILDELILGGELQETNKREVLRVCAQQDDLMEADDTVRRPR